MAVNCGVPYGLCEIRVTLLDDEGNADDDFAVSRNPITVGFNPNIDQGTDVTSRNGCGCAVAKIKAQPVFNWFELTFGKDVLEPHIEALMTGDTPITDPANGNLIVGINGASALDATRSRATWPSRCGPSTTSPRPPTACTGTSTGCFRPRAGRGVTTRRRKAWGAPCLPAPRGQTRSGALGRTRMDRPTART